MPKTISVLKPVNDHASESRPESRPDLDLAAPPRPDRAGFRWGRWLLLGAAAALAIAAAAFTLHQRGTTAGTTVGTDDPPAGGRRERGAKAIRVVRPELRNMTDTVAQPGFVEAYEQTAIFSKVSGFIKKFDVDIGDRVKEGQVLCEIDVPELRQEHQKKVAQVKLDASLVDQAEQLVKLAETKINMAIADQKEAEANVGKYQADVVRWGSELKRITQMVAEKIVDSQLLDETRKQFESSKSAWEAAQSAVAARKAAERFAEAERTKAQIDVKTAKANVEVSQAEERRLAALLGYTKITAPYDGVLTARNANTGDYVESVSGDKAASGGVPMFVVAQTGLVRIFVDVPEQFARYVRVGTKAGVCAEALSGLDIPATVTRTAWCLNQKTRSLRAEIDLPAEKYGLRPGMYVYAKVLVERPAVRALPQEALATSGNQTYCYLLAGGKAVKTPVETGISDGNWVEVSKLKIGDPWVKVTGAEQFITGDLSDLTNGQTVK